MSKLSLVLVAVSVCLTADVGAMKGGQILEKPLPYTVYILTGDRDDVFYMRGHGQKYKIQEGAKTESAIPLKMEEYHGKEENNAASPVGGGERTLNNKSADTSGAVKVPINVQASDIKAGNISPDVKILGDAGEPSSNSGSAETSNNGKSAPVSQGEAGRIVKVEGGAPPETKTEKSDEKGSPDQQKGKVADTENGGKSSGTLGALKANLVELDSSKGLQEDKMKPGENIIPSPTLSEVKQHRDGSSRDEKVPNLKTSDTTSKVRTAVTGNDFSTSGGDSTTTSGDSTTTSGESTTTNGDSTTTSGDSTTTSGDSTATSEESENPSWGVSESHDTSKHFNDTKNSLPHCKLAAATASPTTITEPPGPNTMWRMCMGVIFDDLTILTGDICFARAEGLHFFASVNVTNHEEAQEITKIANGRNHFDFRVIRLNENQTLPGEIPDWQDEDTVYWNMEEMSNNSRTGIVPTFGYPNMVAALKLLPLKTCQKIYDELLDEYPAQTSTLPAFLLDTVVCATQADKPIDFPDGVGLVKPGLACPDSLGAPFILDDGTVLGVLVAADCQVKNVAFFQTLGKGFPTVDEEEEEEIEVIEH